MRVVDIINVKRDGGEIPHEDIKTICEEYTKGNIPDYQISALLMAIYFNGLNETELLTLTHAMCNSGRTISVPTNKFVVDKHSTGGVGDKVSLALSPILAALDFSLVKLSGKGLGHTGGTIDKFESLTNFQFNPPNISLENFLEKCGFALLSGTDEIVPLDKKLYALRDVTATVKSIPLIASSIMSKKLAVQSNTIILDIKVGAGAFMKTLSEAKLLAQTMKKIGEGAGRKTTCVLTDMEQPLGWAVGNALELREAVEILKGNGGPEDLLEVVYTLAGIALVNRGDIQNYKDGEKIVKDIIHTGTPFEKLQNFVSICGGNKEDLVNEAYLGDTKSLEIFPTERDIFSPEKLQYVKNIDALSIGNAAMLLGAGRATKTDTILHEVGIVLRKKRGTTVKKGDSIATIYYTDKTARENLSEAEKIVKKAYTYCRNKDEVLNIPTIHEVF